jgi:hypothetical protein
MHRNLVTIQEEIIENARENLEILEIRDKKLMIAPVLAVAERPLSEREIADRAGVGEDEIRKGLDYWIERDLVVKTGSNASGEVVYELNPEMEKIAARNIQSKLEALRNNSKKRLAECDKLLESAKAEFDDYDMLMAKYLRERIGKIKFLAAIITRRNSLLHLLDSSEAQNAEIKRISIE